MSTVALLLLVGQVQPDPLDRLIAEVKGPSKLRRDVAAYALAAYGAAAAEKLDRAKVDRAIIAAGGFHVPDPKLGRKFRTMKIDLAFENTRLRDILGFVSDFSGAEVIVDPAARDHVDSDKQITFKVKDLSAHNTLLLLGAQFGLSVFYRNGGIVLSDAEPAGPARAPLRIGHADAAGGRLIKALASDSVGERADAAAGLRRLNFAAEATLWKALDSKDAEVRAQAARLIRRLYSAAEGEANPPLWTTPKEARQVEALVADLESDVPSRWERATKGFRELGKRALAPLREAERLLDKAARERARDLLLKR